MAESRCHECTQNTVKHILKCSNLREKHPSHVKIIEQKPIKLVWYCSSTCTWLYKILSLYCLFRNCSSTCTWISKVFSRCLFKNFGSMLFQIEGAKNQRFLWSIASPPSPLSQRKILQQSNWYMCVCLAQTFNTRRMFVLDNQTLVILVFSADRFSLNKYDNCNLIWQPTLTDYITYYSV